MQTPQKTKKQHYLPQKSLYRFEAERDEVFVFDKQTNVSYPAEIAKTACQQYFYDLKTVDHDPSNPQNFQIAERAFCEVERQGQPVIDSVIQAAETFRHRRTKKHRE